MTKQTEAERLAKALEGDHPAVPGARTKNEAAAELRRLVSFNQQLMDEVARLNKAVADEREACAKVCDFKALTWRVRPVPMLGYSAELEDCAAAIRARGNT